MTDKDKRMSAERLLQLERTELEPIAAEFYRALKAEREKVEELQSGLNLLFSWADNWDSPFMEDDEWVETDGPKIRALLTTGADKK